MKRFFLLLLLAGCLFSASAQNTFQKGFIITPSGDTTTGYVLRKTYFELTQGVTFKKGSEDAAPVLYTTNDLKGFGFESGDVFSTVHYKDPGDGLREKTEFGRIVLEGYYTLFALPRESVFEYLIQSPDTSYKLYDDVLSKDDNQVHLGNYRNTLFFLARNCPAAATNFEQLSFSDRVLADEVSRINTCHQSKSQLHHNKTPLDKHVYAYAGAFGLSDKWSQRTAGVELRLRNLNLNRKASLVVGLHYSRTDIPTGIIYYYPPPVHRKHEITEIYSVPVALHYTFFTGALQPYAYFGFGGAYQKNNFLQTPIDKGFQQKFGLSVLGGVGIEYYPIKFVGIKADWRYELLMQRPTLGIVFRL